MRPASNSLYKNHGVSAYLSNGRLVLNLKSAPGLGSLAAAGFCLSFALLVLLAYFLAFGRRELELPEIAISCLTLMAGLTFCLWWTVGVLRASLPWVIKIRPSDAAIQVSYGALGWRIGRIEFNRPTRICVNPARGRGDWGFSISLRDERGHNSWISLPTIISSSKAVAHINGRNFADVLAKQLQCDVEMAGWDKKRLPAKLPKNLNTPQSPADNSPAPSTADNASAPR
jgi:hypothetical protein